MNTSYILDIYVKVTWVLWTAVGVHIIFSHMRVWLTCMLGGIHWVQTRFICEFSSGSNSSVIENIITL